MANLVITIGRENGSGGRQLGSELAAALGVKCYDSELINETAKASGFAKSFVETHEEQRPGSFLYSLVTGGGSPRASRASSSAAARTMSCATIRTLRS